MIAGFRQASLLICSFTLCVLCAGCGSDNDSSGPGVGEPCGGIAGIGCESGLYCRFEPGTCGEFDLTGTCEDIPDICTLEYAPVCGCDDKTYSNDCSAAASGVSVRSSGQCA